MRKPATFATLAVVLAVPIPLLDKYIERCLALDLHLLSEKPVAASSAPAARLVAIYRQKKLGLVWCVAATYRLEPAVTFASDIVRTHPSAPKHFYLMPWLSASRAQRLSTLCLLGARSQITKAALCLMAAFSLSRFFAR